LTQALSHARNKRVARSKWQDKRGQIPDMLSIAEPMRHSMTYDQGREMAFNKELNNNTGIAVYFGYPYSPWQRGSNENMNRLVRQCLPEGTDLSVYSQAQLDAIADQINSRPRKGLWGYDPQWRCTQNCCATANNIQRSSINRCSVALHF
jgi:IS30 family transposase